LKPAALFAGSLSSRIMVFSSLIQEGLLSEAEIPKHAPINAVFFGEMFREENARREETGAVNEKQLYRNTLWGRVKTEKQI